MLEKIKKGVFASYNSEEKKGVFLSWFDENRALLISQWIVFTEKPLHKTIDMVYQETIKKHLKETLYVVCDVVSETIEIHDIKEVLTLSPKEFGFIVIDKKDDASGVILPNTEWVADTQSALSYLKKKYGIHGKVEIFAFRTDRIIISK